MKKNLKYTLYLIISVILISCNKNNMDTSELYKKSQTKGEIIARSGTMLTAGSDPDDLDTQLKDAENRLRTGGGLLGKKPTNLINLLGGNKNGTQVTSVGFPINPYLWKASLETLEFMPFASVDPMSGIIITDWYTDAENIKERCKINVFISGVEFNSKNLKVKAFCQKISSNNTWVNQEQSEENNIKLESAILNKAKKIRVKNLQ